MLAAIVLVTVLAGVARYESGVSRVVAFVLATLALAGDAWIVSFATEQVGKRFGPAITGMLQSTLGNLPEFFVVIFALNAGQRIVAQTVEVIAVLVAAGDGEGPRRDQLDHLVPDPALVAPIGHGVGEPPAHADPPLRLAQQEQTTVGRLIATLEINCELLAPDGWQVKRQRRIVDHGACGVAVIREARRLDTDLLRHPRHLHHSRQHFAHARCMITARSASTSVRIERNTGSGKGGPPPISKRDAAGSVIHAGKRLADQPLDSARIHAGAL